MRTNIFNHKEKLLRNDTLWSLIQVLIGAQNDGICTVSFDLSGHCELFTVRIHAPEWTRDSGPTFSDEAYINATVNSDENLENLKLSVIEYINSIK